MSIVIKKAFKLLAKVTPSNSLRIFLLRKCSYRIGKNTYIGEEFLVIDNLSEKENVVIGDRVSIAPRVTIITHSHSNFSSLRTKIKDKEGKVVIENDSWIGTNSVIMPGISIGKSSVVGAGSIVTKNVPAGVIVAGNPARIIRKVV